MKKLILIAALSISSPAVSEELTAGQLFAFCVAQDEIAQTACKYFILGAVTGITLGDSAVVGTNLRATPRTRSHHCAPDDMLARKLVEIFSTTVRQLASIHPEDLQFPAISIVDAAMLRNFPCKN